MNTCEVIFHSSSRRYSYLYPESIELQVGDFVVVSTPDFGLKVCEVVNLLQGAGYNATKRIVTKVDLSEYESWMKIEEEKVRLKDEIKSRTQQLLDAIPLDQLAASDNRLSSMLRELNNLGGSVL